jgi:nitrogen fixation-related uncharacterized protein
MFTLLRMLVGVAICLVAIGLYRGWFSLTNATRDPETHKVNISVSVDADKVKADAQRVKAKIAQEVAQRVRQLDQAAQPQTLK